MACFEGLCRRSVTGWASCISRSKASHNRYCKKEKMSLYTNQKVESTRNAPGSSLAILWASASEARFAYKTCVLYITGVTHSISWNDGRDRRSPADPGHSLGFDGRVDLEAVCGRRPLCRSGGAWVFLLLNLVLLALFSCPFVRTTFVRAHFFCHD